MKQMMGKATRSVLPVLFRLLFCSSGPVGRLGIEL